MPSVTLIQGDCIQTMRTLPSGSVQCCVTSPPYFGLRDYQTATWEGGDSECGHVADATKTKKFGNPEFNENRPSREATKTDGYYFKDICAKCGAKRVDNQIGLESTPEAYVAKLVEVFREVRRVLKDDGVLWLNLGDSYAGSHGTGGKPGDKQYTQVGSRSVLTRPDVPVGCKPKDLIGIPWAVAFALRADGWYLRSDIIWHKPNPMPESVTDRPTKAHEYIFLLSKSSKYFYDADAVREEGSKNSHGGGRDTPERRSQLVHGRGSHKGTLNAQPAGENGRNRRSVWTVTTKPYSGAHFATFPPDLIEPCILAGSRVGDTVLDPFNGSGTTGAVSVQHGRKYIGCELNPDYIELAHERIGRVQPTMEFV